MDELKHFNKLFAINCNDKTERKNNGSKDLIYLSWTYAWAEVKKVYPDADYNIKKFGELQLPYVFDEKTGYMVFTDVTIEGITHEMWLPVMDSSNKAMKDKIYTYTVAKYEWQKGQKVKTGEIEKKVESATMFDINKTIMRCLVKNLAMFGLGLYIYSGEDLPDDVVKESTENIKTPYDFEDNKITEEQMAIIASLDEDLKEHIRKTYKKDPITITRLEAETVINSLKKRGLIKTKEEKEIENKNKKEVF